MDSSLTRGNVRVDFVSVPFSEETTSIDFNIPFSTRPAVTCQVIGGSSVPLRVDYITEEREGLVYWTGIEVIPQGNQLLAQFISMIAIGRVDIKSGGFA